VFRDGTGSETSTTVRLRIDDLAIEPQMLMNALRTPSVLGAPQRDYLDRAGNRNGRFDIGDLRAYLLRNGAIR
jgi:hypothetical protein